MKEPTVKKRLSIALLGTLISLGAFAATPKDTLVVAKNIEDIVSLDPAEAFEFSSGEVVSNVYEGLIQYDARDPSKIQPAIAASWKAGANGKSMEFVLRPGAVFAGGNPIRYEDVLFSFRRVLKLNKAPAFILTQLGWNNDNIAQMVTKTPTNASRWPGAETSGRATCSTCWRRARATSSTRRRSCRTRRRATWATAG